MQPDSTNSESRHPEVIGHFRVLELIGEGSAGLVFVAERIDFPQRVAIKLLHPDVRPSVLEQQDRGLEQRLLASLDQSNIVRLIDQGVILNASGQSQIYLVLEHVDGMPIDQYCDRNRLTVDTRVALLLKVVEAVSYAHRHLVIHGDLKPSNILVNSVGEPKLLDFSIGSFLNDPPASANSNYTPAFASPEQLRNEPATIASDVYTLGLVATLLLSGVHARTARLADESGETVLTSRRLRQLDSCLLTKIADARSTTPAGLRAKLAGDLDAILAKSVQRQSELRYSSAESLSDDLRAYSSGRPIQARHSGAPERTRKWIKRHWAVASMATVLVAVILFSAVGIIIQTAQAERQRRQAQATLHELVKLTGALDGELYDSIDALDHAEAARTSLLTNATQTIDRISTENIEDSLLLLELAQQYGKLAKLQAPRKVEAQDHANPNSITLDQSTQYKDSRKDALADIQKGLALLRRITPSDSHSRDAAQLSLELIALQNSIAKK